MPDAPQMPSLLVCFPASTVPPLWDRHFASAEEKELARQGNQAVGLGSLSARAADKAQAAQSRRFRASGRSGAVST